MSQSGSTRRFRVAVVAACPFPYPRGTPIRIHRLSETLGRRGHDVHVVTYHLGDPLDDAPFSTHRIAPVASYTRTAPGPSYRKLFQLDHRLMRRLAELLRAREFDVVHAHHYEGLLVALRATRGRCPIVYDAHTTLESELPYYGLGLPRWLKQRVGAALDRRLPGRADHTVAVTDTIRDTLVGIGAVAPDAISVVSNGVESALFLPRAPVSDRGSAGPRTVVFAGNLAAYQGIDLLLEAFAEVRRRRDDVRLRLVSESSFTEFAPLAERLGVYDAIDVDRCGFDGVPDRLSRADVAVSPRVRCQGIPQKLLNYMAAGCAIVSFDGSATLLRHDVTALRVEDGDTRGMADAIIRLLDDDHLRARLGAAAREQVERERSWTATARAVERIYELVVDAADGSATRS